MHDRYAACLMDLPLRPLRGSRWLREEFRVHVVGVVARLERTLGQPEYLRAAVCRALGGFKA